MSPGRKTFLRVWESCLNKAPHVFDQRRTDKTDARQAKTTNGVPRPMAAATFPRRSTALAKRVAVETGIATNTTQHRGIPATVEKQKGGRTVVRREFQVVLALALSPPLR